MRLDPRLDRNSAVGGACDAKRKRKAWRPNPRKNVAQINRDDVDRPGKVALVAAFQVCAKLFHARILSYVLRRLQPHLCYYRMEALPGVRL